MPKLKDGTHYEVGAAAEEIFRKPGFVHYVGFSDRPGVLEAARYLEYKFYLPGLPSNADFWLALRRWEGLNRIIISIPEGHKERMAEAAEANGLRVVDGIPLVLSSAGHSWFPYRGQNVFSLENVPGHPVYENRPIEEV